MLPALRDRPCKEANMNLVIWTKDKESGDLVPYEYGEVEEVYIERTEDVRISAKNDKIEVMAKA